MPNRFTEMPRVHLMPHQSLHKSLGITISEANIFFSELHIKQIPSPHDFLMSRGQTIKSLRTRL